MDSISDIYTYLSSFFPNVSLYFQPPESIKLDYPCLIYSLDNIIAKYAGNRPYNLRSKYSLMLITKDLDESLLRTLCSLEGSRFERMFIYENLYHFVATIH